MRIEIKIQSVYIISFSQPAILGSEVPGPEIFTTTGLNLLLVQSVQKKYFIYEKSISYEIACLSTEEPAIIGVDYGLGMAMLVRGNVPTANICAYMRKYCIYAPICEYAH